jgi:transposase
VPCTGSTPPPTRPDQQLPAIPPEIADPLLASWRHALLVGLAEHRRVPGRRQSKTRNLLERLRDRDEQVLLFARDLSVPFTNNQAERDLRPTKTQMKISGCHRSETTAKAWLRVRGYISTVRKHGDNVLDALRDAITGSPWKPPLAC